MGFWDTITPRMVDARLALAGRDGPVLTDGATHAVFGTDLRVTPEGSQVAYFALGCFWGAEQLFWTTPGVTSTSVGYQGGFTPNPTYAEVCSGRTGHTETVQVCFDPSRTSFEALVRIFFENHDPTQGMRQGNDVGTQYRSAIFTVDAEQDTAAHRVRAEFAAAFVEAGYGEITTEIAPAGPYHLAEIEHQQYLLKNPGGYCPIHATGVTCRPATVSE